MIVQNIDDVLIKVLTSTYLYFLEATNSYGFSLILLSLACSLLIHLIGRIFKNYSLDELEIQKIIYPQIEKIKSTFSGKERHVKIRNVYKRFSYKPIYAIKTLIPFLIQLPFLLSAYYMLYDFKFIKGKGFGIIKDLNQADGLIYSFNVLPVLMTLLLILLSTISKTLTSKERYRSYFISLAFLLLLYNSPSSLIIFWTANSIFLFILSNPYFRDIQVSYNKYFILAKSFIVKYLTSKFSLLLLLIPYLTLKLEDEYFFNYLFLPCIVIILIIDQFFNRLNLILKLSIYVLVSYFFYSLILYNDTFLIYQSLKFRYFSLILITAFFIFYSVVLTFKKERFLNVFLIIFSVLGIITGNKSLDKSAKGIRDSLKLSSSKMNFDSKIYDKKPIILIIIDELASSDKIYEYTNSHKDLTYDNFLIKNDFILKSNFISHSKKTKISITSMLNFNLGKNTWIKDYEKRKEYASTNEEFNILLKDNLLVESLTKKGVKSFSLGKVNFKYGKILKEDIFYIWENIGFNKFHVFFKENKILQSFFMKSVLSFIDSNLHTKTFIADGDRKQTFDNLNSISFQKNSFYLFHLDAPHDPFSFYDEFPFIDVDFNDEKAYVDSYILYRRFILNKLIQILKNQKNKDSRIILVGDHGLRTTDVFNPFETMAGFYGFNSIDIEKLKEVQDIGALIDHYLK